MKSLFAVFLIAILPAVARAQQSGSLKKAQYDRTQQATPTPADLPADSQPDPDPGKKIIYSTDFSKESTGAFPAGWKTNGSGSVVAIEGLKGKWLQLTKDAFYLSGNKALLTENFTVEFRLLLRRTNPKGDFPQMGFGMMSTQKDGTTYNQSFRDYQKYFAAELKIQPFDYNGSHMHYESFEKHERYLETQIKKYPLLEKYFNKPLRITIKAEGPRLRIWLNDTKLYDLPDAIKAGIPLNQLFFFVKGNGSNLEEVSYNITDIIITKTTGL